jgi:hypothetical protein
MEPERKPAWRRAVVTGDAGFIGTHLRRAEADVAIGLPSTDQADLVVHLPEVSWCDGLAETLAWFAARMEASAGVRA